MALTHTQKKLMETLIFLVRLAMLSLPVYIIMNFTYLLYPVQLLVAKNVYNVLQLLGFHVTLKDITIIITENAFVFLISEDCTGWKSMLFFIALVVATMHVDVKKKICGILVGVPIVYAGNIIRILAVVFVQQRYGITAAKLFHDYLWQAGLISLVLLTWVVWLMYAGKVNTSFLKKNRINNNSD
ncbi:MAG: exosortase/archaeosortase family protein [Candidatus Aenigmarchaeota archaeon]|nr:exosortase/archaeosortase family protein [Candidatus Aenigmarchaeota archaeon]